MSWNSIRNIGCSPEHLQQEKTKIRNIAINKKLKSFNRAISKS